MKERNVEDIIRAILGARVERQETEDGIELVWSDDVPSSLPTLFGRYRCNLLIGSGCSSTGRIPTGAEVWQQLTPELDAAKVHLQREEYLRSCVDEIIKMQADAVGPAQLSQIEILLLSLVNRYSITMTSLAPPQRRALMEGMMKDCVVNSEHENIAKLMVNHFVDRVLTTNFDNLLHRALADEGHQELAQVIDVFNDDLGYARGDKPCIVHLHGRSDAFLQAHSLSEFRDKAARIGRHFRNATFAGPWLVVGYSGEADIVFDLLVQQEHRTFEHGLFWVCRDGDVISYRVQKRLLESFDGAYVVRSKDAATLFDQLATRLRVSDAPVREGVMAPRPRTTPPGSTPASPGTSPPRRP